AAVSASIQEVTSPRLLRSAIVNCATDRSPTYLQQIYSKVSPSGCNTLSGLARQPQRVWRKPIMHWRLVGLTDGPLRSRNDGEYAMPKRQFYGGCYRNELPLLHEFSRSMARVTSADCLAEEVELELATANTELDISGNLLSWSSRVISSLRMAQNAKS